MDTFNIAQIVSLKLVTLDRDGAAPDFCHIYFGVNTPKNGRLYVATDLDGNYEFVRAPTRAAARALLLA